MKYLDYIIGHDFERRMNYTIITHVTDSKETLRDTLQKSDLIQNPDTLAYLAMQDGDELIEYLEILNMDMDHPGDKLDIWPMYEDGRMDSMRDVNVEKLTEKLHEAAEIYQSKRAVSMDEGGRDPNGDFAKAVADLTEKQEKELEL